MAMMNTYTYFAQSLLGMGMLGLALPGNSADMSVLYYRDQDAGMPSYLTRVLITPDFVRVDEGMDAGDFVILNRKSGEMTNVLHDTKTAMKIRNKPMPEALRPMWRADERVDDVRPGTERVTLSAKGKVCSQTVTVRKLMPEAVKGLIEYKSALAWTQYQTYKNTPDELRSDCDLVHHVWEAGRALSHGLPIEERDYEGRTRVLEKQGKEKFNGKLFKFPSDYAVVYATQE